MANARWSLRETRDNVLHFCLKTDYAAVHIYNCTHMSWTIQSFITCSVFLFWSHNPQCTRKGPKLEKCCQKYFFNIFGTELVCKIASIGKMLPNKVFQYVFYWIDLYDRIDIKLFYFQTRVWCRILDKGVLEGNQWPHWLTRIIWISIAINVWIMYDIHVKQCDVVAHPCPNCNGGLVKYCLRWVNISYWKQRAWLTSFAQISVSLCYHNMLLQVVDAKSSDVSRNILGCVRTALNVVWWL